MDSKDKILNLLSVLKKYSTNINHLDSNNFQKLFNLIFEHFYNISYGNQLVNDNQQQQQLAFTNSDITLSSSIGCGGGGDVVDDDHHHNDDDDDDDDNQLRKLLENSTINNDDDNYYLLAKFLLKFYSEIFQLNLKTKSLKNLLTKSEWSDEKIELFIEHYQQNSLKIFNQQKSRSFELSTKYLLKNLDRKLKILSDHSQTSKPKLPLCEINFQFNSNDDDDSNNLKNLTLTFNHSELLNFYDQIEIIQSKIDKLYK
ncbi:COMM domain-containing protein 10 [Dermatophagoides pteronyssinus]|uniref:COMM domain-containing protein 10 n=1 Tax=Dermatophagoides pteronyssinus TaxID=6956 RepID=A0ABQ8J217_DERPT|nr:COMM domain-containing protein 10 [Dermatophagoides pteronyssinus]